jgi:DNA-binding transcriptional LysR family regulator
MLKKLTYIIAVAENGNVSKAADALFITQPSLSRYIKNLERQLGLQLFQRTNNRLVLTYAGEKYVTTARKIIEMYSGLEQDLSSIHEELSGRLKVGCAVLRMSYNMPAILKSFITKFPNVDLQLFENYTTKGLEGMLLNGDIDIAIINQRNLPKLDYIPFFKEELVLAVPPTQVLAMKGVIKQELKYPWIDIRLVQDQPYIRLNSEQSIAIKTQRILDKYHIVPSSVLEVKSVESAFRMAEVGLGCAIIPETIIKIPSVETAPKFFSFGEPITTWNLAIAYREGTVFSSAAIEFIKLVKSIHANIEVSL